MEILHIYTQYFGDVSVQLPGWIVGVYAMLFVLGILIAATKD